MTKVLLETMRGIEGLISPVPANLRTLESAARIIMRARSVLTRNAELACNGEPDEARAEKQNEAALARVR